MNNKNHLKRVLITGASGGIGRAIAKRLATDGFSICLHYHKNEQRVLEVKQAIETLGGHCSLISFDVGDNKDSSDKISQDIENNGAFYGVIANAGITEDSAFPMMSYDSWSKVLNTNLNGFYNTVQPSIMPMISRRLGGRIIAISSISGIIGNRGQVNYSASKAGLIGAVKSLAVELAKRKITVNCVAPGLIDTEMADIEEFTLKKALEMIPMQRMGQPQEIAGIVAFLMSDDASYITRQVISVNGGMI